MSASFKVNQPTEFTINIGVTIHNGTLTLQPQLLPQQQQQQQQVKATAQQQQQPRMQLKTSPDHSLDDLLRGLSGLSMNGDPVETVEPHHFLSGMDDQEPPTQLDLSRRRQRNAQGACPVGIPIVSDPSEGAGRRRGGQGGPRVLVKMKTPDNAQPTRAGGAAKLQCVPHGQSDLGQLSSAIEGDIGASELRRKQRFASEGTESVSMPDSPFQSGSSHASSSPPTSYVSVPTPPMPMLPTQPPAQKPPTQKPKGRPRGRPRKVVATATSPSGLAQPMAAPFRVGPTAAAASPLQPRPASGDFVSTIELAEAEKVISRYSDEELLRSNDRGDLMSHTLAREGNWAKLMALNKRWLSNASLGDVFTSINAANMVGHTPIAEAVRQQNVKAVEYCCLFTSSSECLLFRALAEAALLPSDAIFYTILRTICHELDENGNSVKRPNKAIIDKPIAGWSFANAELENYAGLTLLQALTLQPAALHGRLAHLIGCGADPLRQVGIDAAHAYRPYSDCLLLAAAFSPAPYECMLALGLLDSNFGGRYSGDNLHWCINTIYARPNLPLAYRESVKERLLIECPPLPQLDADDIDSYLLDLESPEHEEPWLMMPL